MFLCHARWSPILVVHKKPVLVVQENLKTFNFGQAFGASIWLGGIHFARNQIVRVDMFLCHARLHILVVHKKPVLIVQENLKTFNVG